MEVSSLNICGVSVLLYAWYFQAEVPFSKEYGSASLPFMHVTDCWHCCFVAIILKWLCSHVDHADQLVL